MPQLSLSDFVHVALSNDQLSKINKLIAIKNRPPYSPATDFWKPLRDKIVETHENGLGKNNLDSVLPCINHKKLINYQDAIASYKKWWGRKNLVWFTPQAGTFSQQNIDIKVNPELGLSIDGNQHLVKLYFNAEPINSRHAEIILLLMSIALSQTFPGVTMAVLDIPRNRLLTTINNIPLLQLGLQGEISYIASVWNQI